MIVTIDPRSFEPVYLQLARILRDAVRDALQVLRSEGAIVTVKGAGSFVRGRSEMDVVRLPEDARVTSRMPTADERRSLGVGEGVPVFVVTAGETVQIYPADRTVLVTSGG